MFILIVTFDLSIFNLKWTLSTEREAQGLISEDYFIWTYVQ